MTTNSGRPAMSSAGLRSHVESHVIRDSVSGKQGLATFNVDDLPDRLRSKIVVQDDGCWLWTAACMPGGYGVTGGFRSGLAHRAMYELLAGAIPEGLHLDHTCRVRNCVNPAHLEPVTHRENVLRGIGWAAVNAKKTHCVRGHEFTAENTYRPPRRQSERHCKLCWQARRDEYRAARRELA